MEPAAGDGFRRQHFSLLRDAIAEAGGSEVKSLGDGLMVAFAASSAALRCAIAMQRAVHHHNTLTGSDAGLRIGLSGGSGHPGGRGPLRRSCHRGGQIVFLGVRWADSGHHRDALPGRASRPGEVLASRAPGVEGLPGPVDVVEVLWLLRFAPAPAGVGSPPPQPRPPRDEAEPRRVGNAGGDLRARLRRAREQEGVSLREMARRLIRSHSNLWDYERGHRLATAEIAAEYERECGLAEGELQRPLESARRQVYGVDRDRRRPFRPAVPRPSRAERAGAPR